MDKKRVAEKMKSFREAQRLSMKDLQRKTGVSEGTISRFESSGDTSFDTFLRMCDGLGVDPAEAINGSMKETGKPHRIAESLRVLLESRIIVPGERVDIFTERYPEYVSTFVIDDGKGYRLDAFFYQWFECNLNQDQEGKEAAVRTLEKRIQKNEKEAAEAASNH